MKKQLNKLLSWTETFARVDIRYLLSGGFFLTLNQITSAIFGLVLTIAFANLVEPEVYGTYKYVLATYSLFTIVTLPGADTAILRAIAQGREYAFTAGIKLKAKWGLLGTMASIAYAAYNFSLHNTVLGNIFILVAIVIPFMETGTLYIAYFNAKKQYRLWTLAEIVTQTISTISLLTTMYLSTSLIVLMIAYFLPYVLARSILTYFVAKCIHQEYSNVSDVQTYARSVTVFQVLTKLITSADQIVLFHFLGPASVAIFSIASAIPNRIKSVFRITGTLAFPKLVNRTGTEMFTTMPRKMLLFGIAILGICISYAIVAPLFFTYIFPKYMHSVAFSQILVFSTISSITYPFSSFLFAQKKIKENYVFAVTSFTVKISSLVLLVPLYGIWGAVFGTLAAAFATILCAFYYLYKGRNDSVPNIDNAESGPQMT